MRWTLDQLRTFLVVAEQGTMTAAAASLGYTTGAVSQQMASLAVATGRVLFVRDGTGLSLSDDGRLLLGQVRPVLDAERRAADALRGTTTPAQVPVRLGVFGSAAVAAVPAARDRLAEAAPHVQVRAVEVDVEAMPEAVLGGEIDLALGLDYSDAPLPPRRGLDVSRLCSEPLELVLPGGAEVDPSSPDAVRAYANATDWILPPSTGTFGKAVRFACARAGISPREQHLVTDTAVCIALAESGVGITLVTPLMRALRPTTAAVVPLPGRSSRDVVVLARTASLERASILAVRDALAAVFPVPTPERSPG